MINKIYHHLATFTSKRGWFYSFLKLHCYCFPKSFLLGELQNSGKAISTNQQNDNNQIKKTIIYKTP